MHILELKILGFRSYKEECVLKFEKGLNALVGKNGSGKSNIVSAIAFVFGANLSSVDKDNLQNHLADDLTQTQVTILLDNSDNRFVDGNLQKVSLSRAFFRGKYTYQFNSKFVAKKEYRQILSSAGLHEQLNFYIVKQGMISQLSSENPNQRLYTFKDIAGHKTFETKAIEAKQVLRECNVKKSSIEGYLDHLKSGIKIVQNEHKRISEWNEIESQRKLLEQQLKLFQLDDIKAELKKLLQEKHNKNDLVSHLAIRLSNIKNSINENKEKNKIIEALIANKSRQLKHLQNELFNTIDKINTIEQQSSNNKQTESSNSAKISELEEELKNVVQRTFSLQSEHDQAKSALENCERKINSINREDDMNNFFGDKNNIISKVEEMITVASHEKKTQIAKVNNLKDEIKKIQTQIATLESELEEYKASSDVETRLNEHQNEMSVIMEKKRDLQLKFTQINNNLSQLKFDYQSISKSYSKAISYSNKSCIDIVKLWVTEKKITATQFYGFIVDTFNCDPEFYKCIEQVAMHKLFNVVVSTLQVAQDLLAFASANQGPAGGRLVIIIAETLEINKALAVPNDCIRILECIEYSKDLNKVLNHVFGNTLLIPNIKSANQLISSGFDCVTLEGEAFFKNGRIRVGSYMTDSPIELHKKIKEIEASISTLENDFNNVKSEIELVDNILTEMEKKRLELNEESNTKRSEVLRRLNEISALKSLSQRLEDNLRQVVIRGETLDFQIGEWNKQIASLETIKYNRENADKKLDYKAELQQAINERQLSLEHLDYITKKLENIKSKEKSIRESLSLLKNNRLDFESSKNLKKDASNLQMRINEEEVKIVEAKKKSFDLINEINKQQLLEMDVRREWTDEFSNISQLDKKIASTESKIEKLKQSESLLLNNEFGKLSKDEVITKLREINTLLKEKTLTNSAKQMSHYSSLLTQFATIETNYQSLCSSNDSIELILRKLEEMKSNHFVEYINNVNDKLSDIFNMLVPSGSAKLIITENGNGLDIQISFGTNVEPNKNLSGGQKSLVSLALILSLQQTELCPFLVMDEIDAALDDTYREKLSLLLDKLSKKGFQVIFTTHSPQLLQPANKIFHIQKVGGLSKVEIIDKTEALALL